MWLTLCILVDLCWTSPCHLRGAGSILPLLFFFHGNPVSKHCVDPDQTPHYVTSDLGLHCMPMTLLLNRLICLRTN